jgi:hypothetical protein
MAIYPAALIPIIIMGVVLGIGKISGTVWLKQNWEWSPFFLKAYVLPAIVVLMLITSLGVFGFLSKAHSDQSLVSGDVQSKIAVYDEKIKTAKDNIDANRKALKQMDEAVDQVMGRSSDEKGADKAVGIRRAQQKERVRLQSEIAVEQKTIASISEERAPIAAEVRKVDAEVGPIKYIAHLLYGENPDANILEKAVIWVTVLIVIVLDPLAVVLLLASQYSFQYFRQQEEATWIDEQADELTEAFNTPDPYVADVGEKPTEEELSEGDSPPGPVVDIVSPATTVTTSTIKYQILEDVDDDLLVENGPVDHLAYLKKPFEHFKDLQPMPAPTTSMPMDLGRSEIVEIPKEDIDSSPNFEGVKDPNTGEWVQTGPAFEEQDPYEGKEYVMVDGQNMHVSAARLLHPPATRIRPNFTEVIESSGYVQNEEQGDGTKWHRVISEAEYREQANKKNNDNKDNTNNPT